MNREIKFRAWDKTYKRMNYKVQVGNTDYADQNYTCNSIWVDYGDRKSIGWMNADDKCIDLMQFTGLKDKNGKEIYEGDLVQHDAWNYPFEVIFNDEKARFVCKLQTGLTQYIDYERLVVVGNIHETVSA
jgi:uncharacterized phage protein (TIGR01671 family)